MTLVADSPTDRRANADDGDWLPVPAVRTAGWRLAARLAWREVMRRRARTALVVLLIAVPTVAMVVAAATFRTNRATDAIWGARGPAEIVVERYGDADTGSVSAADLTAAGLPNGSTSASYLFSPVVLVPEEPASDTVSVTFSDMPIGDPRWAGLVTIEHGRAPSTPTEMLLGPNTAATLGVGVGDLLTLERPAGTWTVSGIGRMASSYYTELAVVTGFDPARIVPDMRRFETIIDLPDDTPREQQRQIASRVDGRLIGDAPAWTADDTAGLTLGWLAGAMAFIAFGIVIAAAFATSARDQLLSVGQLAANGAPARLVLRVLSWQGLWSGLLGGVLGAAVGLGLLPVLHETAELHVFHKSVSWVVRPLDVAIVVATATAAGLLAARVPSRALARTSVLSALAGRRPERPVPAWLLPVGGALLAGGTGLMTLGLLAGRHSQNITPYAGAAMLGGGAIAVGTCCVAPWIVQQFARLAPHVPLSARLSLRSLARARGRSAAVIAAVAVTVGLATAMVGGLERELTNQLNGSGWLPRDVLIVEAIDQRAGGSIGTGPVEVAAAQQATIPSDVAEALGDLFSDATAVPLRRAVAPSGTYVVDKGYSAALDYRVPIADPAALHAGMWPDSARAQLQELGYARITPPATEVGSSPDLFEPPAPHPAQTFRWPGGPAVIEAAGVNAWGPFATLMTEEFAVQHGLDVVTTGTIVRTAAALTADQRDGADELRDLLHPTQVDLGAFVEPGDPPRPAPDDPDTAPVTHWQVGYQYVDSLAERGLWIARGIALAAAVVLIGVVVAIGLALAAADGRAERDVLTIVGARPASLRRMAASNAVTLSLIGIAVGVPVGFIPAWVVVRAVSATDDSIAFPWLFVGALLAVVPAVMMTTAWAGSALTDRFVRTSGGPNRPRPRRGRVSRPGRTVR